MHILFESVEAAEPWGSGFRRYVILIVLLILKALSQKNKLKFANNRAFSSTVKGLPWPYFFFFLSSRVCGDMHWVYEHEMQRFIFFVAEV